MDYKIVIFDFDGTIADSFPWFKSVINIVAEKYKFDKIKDDDVEKVRSFSTKEVVKYLNIPLYKIPFISKHVKKLMNKNIENIDIFPGFVEILDKIYQKGVKIAVLSSNSKKNIETVLKDSLKKIDYIVSDVSIFSKHKKLKKFIKDIKIDPKNCLYIGDEIRDIIASKKVKIDSGAVSWGYCAPESLKNNNPNFLFEKIDDILKIFKKQ